MTDKPQERCEITQLGVQMLDGKFYATMKIYDPETGKELGQIEARASTLTRLIEIIKPANPENL